MPGALVNEVVTSILIGTVGETVVFDTTQGDVLSYRVYLSYGAWGGASLSLKKLTAGTDPKAFSSPIAITADDGNDAVDLDGASSVVLRVDTASSTTTSVARVVMSLKGDRLPTFAKFGVDASGVFVAANPGGEFDGPGGGPGI